MKRFSLLGVAALLCSISSFSQTATAKRFTAPLSGTVNLADVDDKYNAEVFSLLMPDPDAEEEQQKLQLVKAEVARQFPRKAFPAKYKTTTAPQPIVSKTYVADTLPGIPPDNDFAVSNGNKSVSVMNSSLAVHNAATGQMTYRKSLKSLSSLVGLNKITDYRYDPKVIYDPVADKFICVMLNSTDEKNYIVVGFSATNDPAGQWHFYKFYGDYKADQTWFDYPSISITNTEFFLTGNKIQYSTPWQIGFTQTVVYQIKKQDGYSGSSALNYQVWENIAYGGKNIRNLYPVKGGDAIYGPEQYFLSNRNFDVQNDTVFLIKIADTMGSTGNIVTVTPLKSNLSYGTPPNGRQNDTFQLATNDARVLGAYRAGSEIQFVSTTVHPVTGSAAVYHGKIAAFSTNPVIQASYVMVDTLDFGYPNISYAGVYSGSVHSIISFNYTGVNTYAGLGAVYYDGTQYSDLLKVKTGDSSIAAPGNPDGLQRWGDYMGAQPEWNKPGVVWIEGIYGRKNRDYGNWIARLKSPFATGVDDVIRDNAAVLYPNPAFEFIRLDFEIDAATALSFAIYDVQGRKVDELLQRRCATGKNIIQLNIASLSPGVYFIKGLTPGGRQAMSKRFVKQ